MTIPQGCNRRWSLDFVSEALTCGRRFRIFPVVNDFSRECVRLIADTSNSGVWVARELDLAIPERRARPFMVVSDNGTELTSISILRRPKERNVEWRYFDSGRSKQNGLIESFNARVRDETLFTSLRQARYLLAARRLGYNHHRPHSSLGNKTPAEAAGKISGAPGWRLTPNPTVASAPNRGQQPGRRLYS